MKPINYKGLVILTISSVLLAIAASSAAIILFIQSSFKEEVASKTLTKDEVQQIEKKMSQEKANYLKLDEVDYAILKSETQRSALNWAANPDNLSPDTMSREFKRLWLRRLKKLSSYDLTPTNKNAHVTIKIPFYQVHNRS